VPRILRFWVICGVFAFQMIGCTQTPVLAKSGIIAESLAVRALIGEAGGQKDDELLAHAYALKNRGTLKGVYGLHSKHAKHPSAKVWQRACKAWREANLYPKLNMIGERTEWRSEYDLAKMAKRHLKWADQGLFDPLKVGKTTFFRLRKRGT